MCCQFQAPCSPWQCGEGWPPSTPAARRAGRDDKRRAGPKAPVPCSFNKYKGSLRHPSAVHCSAKASCRLNSFSDSGSSPSFLPSPVTFPLSKSSAMKGHIDSWGHYLVEGTFSRGASEIRRLISPRVRDSSQISLIIEACDDKKFPPLPPPPPDFYIIKVTDLGLLNSPPFADRVSK